MISRPFRDEGETSMHEYVIMAPGQGVQQAGMLDPWLEASARAGGLVTEWSRIVGFDLREASHDEGALRDTAIAQLLIVACALLSMDMLRRRVAMDERRILLAGHSVGELAAAVGAGYLTPATGLSLARARGIAMSAACAINQTGMVAVMPGKRVRIAPLDVAGAFHSEAMATATAPFAQAVRQAQFLESASSMVGNGDGALVIGPEDLRNRLIAQITSAVRWDLCLATIASHASSDALRVELAPAGPLTRLAERAYPGLRSVALRTPQDVGQTGELTATGSNGEQYRLSRTRRHIHSAGAHGVRP
jgi:[acyl-carrier-protein] S-malonyltransferase